LGRAFLGRAFHDRLLSTDLIGIAWWAEDARDDLFKVATRIAHIHPHVNHPCHRDFGGGNSALKGFQRRSNKVAARNLKRYR